MKENYELGSVEDLLMQWEISHNEMDQSLKIIQRVIDEDGPTRAVQNALENIHASYEDINKGIRQLVTVVGQSCVRSQG